MLQLSSVYTFRLSILVIIIQENIHVIFNSFYFIWVDVKN